MMSNLAQIFPQVHLKAIAVSPVLEHLAGAIPMLSAVRILAGASQSLIFFCQLQRSRST